MTPLKTTILAAVVGSIFSLLGMFVNSWLTQGRERRQQVWQTEIKRIIDVEERAGVLVELICGHHRSVAEIVEGLADGLARLESDAGRFRRHRAIMQSIRDLHNRLGCVLHDRSRHDDSRESVKEAMEMYEGLLAACDKVTGKRQI